MLLAGPWVTQRQLVAAPKAPSSLCDDASLGLPAQFADSSPEESPLPWLPPPCFWDLRGLSKPCAFVVSFLSLPPPSRRKQILHSINQPASLSLASLKTRPQILATTFDNFSEPRPFVLFILAPCGPSRHAQPFSVFLQPLGRTVFA